MRLDSVIDTISELFGTSEADAPDVDHSEDAENGRLWNDFGVPLEC